MNDWFGNEQLTINRQSGTGKVLSVFNVQYVCARKKIDGKIIGNNCRPGQLDSSTSKNFTWYKVKQ